MKYGLKLPTTRPDLKFGTIFSNLPNPPMVFGHYTMVQGDWCIFLNDKYSDCVVAGAFHETMLLTAMSGNQISFSDAWAWKDYQAMQGNPMWPFNDGGLDMIKAADYRMATGIHDAHNIRHRIKAYLELPLGDPQHLAYATCYLGFAGVGLNLPANASAQWSELQPWADTSQPPSGEGHYVPCVGRLPNGNFLVVTWGREQEMSPAFYEKYCILGLAYVSYEELNTKGLTPDQYNQAKLNQYLANLRS